MGVPSGKCQRGEFVYLLWNVPIQIFAICYIILGCLQTDARTPNIVAPTMLGVVALVLARVCKRTQHCWPTTPSVVGCYMLRPFVHPVACCWMLLRVVAKSLKPGKLFSQQLPTFLLFRDRRSVAQQGWIRLHNFSNIVGPRTFITHGLQRLMGCILPTMYCRSRHCWELLHSFAHHCQHARNNFQHCWRNNVGSCYVRLHAA